MSMTDPVADMFVRIRNGLAAGKASVRMPASKVKLAIARLLKDEGYLNDVAERDVEGKKEIEIALKYYEGRPAIERLERVSRPGLRRYRGKDRAAEGHGRARHLDHLDFVGPDDGRASARQGPGGRSHLPRRLRESQPCLVLPRCRSLCPRGSSAP